MRISIINDEHNNNNYNNNNSKVLLDTAKQNHVARGVKDVRILHLPIDVLDPCHVCGGKRISFCSGSSASQQGYKLHTSESLCIGNAVRSVSIVTVGTTAGWVITYAFLCPEVK
jgi:hypothetical protein